MAQDLSGVRRGLSGVSTQLKQGNLLSAAQALRAGVQTIRTSSLLHGEMEEFTRLVAEGCALMGYNPDIRRLFPLDLRYTPGEEALLQEVLTELIEVLESETTRNMEALSLQVAARRQEVLDKGKAELAAGRVDAARQIFAEATAAFAADAALAKEIGESFLEKGELEDAARHLERAADIAPTAPLLNQLGMVLRKIRRFDASEERFRQALALEKNDPNLHFNLGRLYLDKQDWKKARVHAREALTLMPDFVEAEKMERYAEKMLDQE